MATISVIILFKNASEEIIPTLKTCSKFADEIVAVDTGSTDGTTDICRKFNSKIVYSSGDSFAKWRNDGAQASKCDWLFYVDSDERITVKLAKEIKNTIQNPAHSAYTIPRYEIFLGKHLEHWGDPRVLRLIKKTALKRWEGRLHEQPKIEGTIGEIREQMVHLSHKNIDEKVPNTLNWSKQEAKLLFDSGHPKMVGWRFLRVMLTEFFHHFVKQGLYRDGTEGYIESIYQSFSVFLTYERLWEMQRQPTLKQTYDNVDKQVLAEWDK